MHDKSASAILAPMGFQTFSPIAGVTHLVFSSMKELTTSMFRIEEFYESPHAAIKGQAFSVEDFIQAYADADGDIAYFRWWDGFNVPRASIDAFDRLFRPHGLSQREESVIAAVRAQGAQYLIATWDGTEPATIAHEIAHARWTLDAAYRARCREAMADLSDSTRRLIVRALRKADYPDDATIMEDEIHAYLKTERKKSLRRLLKAASHRQRRNYLAVRKLLKMADGADL
jgi:hypothetical protein